jgi:ankyrin repeat protein
MTGCDSLASLFEAIEYGDEPRLVDLLASEPDLARAEARHRKTALHMAAEHDRDAMVTRLLDAGADIEAETSWGMTPLQWAANMGSVRAGQVLLSRGAELNLWCVAGLGMLDELDRFWNASGALRPAAAQKIYEQTASGEYVARLPDENDPVVVSGAFYIACRNGHTAVAQILLARGAEVDYKGFFGGTALHWAAGNGHRETVEFLLASRARADLRDDQFHGTPASWALEFGHPEIAALLQP